MITLRESQNLFKAPDGAVRSVEFSPGNVVRDYLPPEFKLDGNYVALDGVGLTGEQVCTKKPKPDSEIHFARVPGVFAALVAAAPAVAAGATAGTAGLIATSAGAVAAIAAVADVALSFAFSLALSYGINALTAKDQVKQKNEEGSARAFEGIQDTAGAGNPIPFIYGKVRTGGQFIQSFEKNLSGDEVRAGITTLFTRIAWGYGPMQSVGDYEINGNRLGAIPGLVTETRLGTTDQRSITGFDEINTQVILESILPRNEPPVFPETSETFPIKTYNTVREVDAFSIVFRFPSGLVRISQRTGSRRNYTVEFSVKYRTIVGPGILPNFTETIVKATGNSTAPLKRIFKVPNLPKARYEIVVQRITQDDDEIGPVGNLISTSELYAVIETENIEQAHPGFANTGFQEVPSELVNGPVPTTYTALIEGFNNVRIYSNETTYALGYTDNNAWCCAHFLTEKHGAGDRYTWDNINLPSFLRWAARCDELVPDGKGGLEKRSVIGHNFDEFRDFKKTIQIFVQGADCNLVFRGNQWWAEVDEPDEMVWVATTANVGGGSFNLGFTPKKERANRITVLYINKDRNYTRDTFPKELPDLQQGANFVDANRELFGTTRTSQITRIVNRLLLRTKLETQTIELEAGLDSLRVSVGRVFGVSLVTGGIGLASGKILKVNDFQSEFTIDEEVILESGKTYEIQVQHANNSAISKKRITNPPGRYLTLSPEDPDWLGELSPGDTYALGEVEASVVKFRCTSVRTDQVFVRKIIGIRYDERVYTDDLTLEPTPIKISLPNPFKAPPPVLDLKAVERTEVTEEGVVVQVIDVDWNTPLSANIDRIRVWKSEISGISTRGPWELVSDGVKGDYYAFPLRESPGYRLFVAVETVTKTGASIGVDASPRVKLTLTGDTFLPPDPTAISATIIDGTLVAIVAEVPAPFIQGRGQQSLGYEWRIGSSWASSILLDRTSQPRLETKSYPRGITNLLVKTFIQGGNFSQNAAAISVSLYGQIEENIVYSEVEAPSWPGQKEGLALNGTVLELSEPIVSMVPALDDDEASVVQGGFSPLTVGYPPPSLRVLLEGVYTLLPIPITTDSLLVVSRPDVSVDFDAVFIGLGTFDDADWAFDDARSDIAFSGDEANNVTYVVESRYSTTGMLDTDFTPWALHTNRGEYLAKFIQFRVRLRVFSDAYSGQLNNVTVTIDLPDKVQAGNAQTLSAVSGEVTYPVDYFIQVKRLLVTQIGGAAGDTQRVYNDTAAGFEFELRDSANALKAGTIHYEARGY